MQRPSTSSFLHAGFVLLAVCTLSEAGRRSTFYYRTSDCTCFENVGYVLFDPVLGKEGDDCLWVPPCGIRPFVQDNGFENCLFPSETFLVWAAVKSGSM